MGMLPEESTDDSRADHAAVFVICPWKQDDKLGVAAFRGHVSASDTGNQMILQIFHGQITASVGETLACSPLYRQNSDVRRIAGTGDGPCHGMINDTECVILAKQRSRLRVFFPQLITDGIDGHHLTVISSHDITVYFSSFL